MLYLPRHPGPPLSQCVESVFFLKNYSPAHSVEKLVPHGRISLVLELDHQPRWILQPETGEKLQECRRAWISGMQQRLMIFTVPQDTELLAIVFQPGGALPVLQTDLWALREQVVPAEDILGESILSLRQQLLGAHEAEGKLDLAEAWLRERADFDRLPPPVMQQGLQALLEEPTAWQLTDSRKHSGYSEKHWIHLFKKFVGLAPKAFQRVLRFQQILPLLQGQQHVDWAGLSLDCGYSDQSHLIRDFKAFSGLNPAEFLQQGHERLNFFPVPPEQ